MSILSVDNRELKNLSRDLKIKRKSQIKAVQREVLNQQAFATRTMSIKNSGTIDQALTIRSGAKLPWPKSSVLVDRTTNKKMQSEIGSKLKWGRNRSVDFHGLGDAENGATWKPNGIVTTMARVSGLWSKNVGKKNRDLLKNPIPINQSSLWEQIRQLIALETKGVTSFFRIRKGNRKFKKGVYRFSKKKSVVWKDGSKHAKIEMMRDESKSSVREKKRPWLRPAVKKAVNNQTIGKMYKDAFIKFTRK